MITALIPAHDEADMIAGTLIGLAFSTVPIDRVVVVADNCTDDTAAIARSGGAVVFETSGNTAKKAGALNQALDRYMPDMGPGDLVLVMDADSVIGPEFIEAALTRLDEAPELAAVGGVFYADNPRGLVERLQANEYRRYSRVIAQKHDRVSVLTGTASLFRYGALWSLLADRGHVYDPTTLTEDNEITLALKSLGWSLTSPQRCTVHTAVMPTWRDLGTQRLRWYRGAIDNLLAYGWGPVTRRYWGQQAGLVASILALASYITFMTYTAAAGQMSFSWTWTGVGAVFLIERIVTVWRQGWRARLLAAALIPELIYDLYLQSVFIYTLTTFMTGRTVRWVHPSIERH